MIDRFSSLNSLIIGVILVGISIVIVLGSMLISFAEGIEIASLTAIPTLEDLNILNPIPTSTPLPSATPTPIRTSKPNPTQTSTLTPSHTPTQVIVACEPPKGWVAHTVRRGDTLRKLLGSSSLTPQELADANCLLESRLQPDTIIYLPPSSPAEITVGCGPPGSWLIYTIQRGDTLYSISRRVNSTVSALKQANCLTSNKIFAGSRLYVPRYPAAIPTIPYIPSPTGAPPTPTLPPPTDIPEPSPTDGTITKRTPYPYPTPP